jgi:hypothetical protein
LEGKRSSRSRFAVEPLEIFPAERSIEPHIGQFLLNAVCSQAFIEVFEINEV